MFAVHFSNKNVYDALCLSLLRSVTYVCNASQSNLVVEQVVRDVDTFLFGIYLPLRGSSPCTCATICKSGPTSFSSNSRVHLHNVDPGNDSIRGRGATWISLRRIAQIFYICKRRPALLVLLLLPFHSINPRCLERSFLVELRTWRTCVLQKTQEDRPFSGRASSVSSYLSHQSCTIQESNFFTDCVIRALLVRVPPQSGFELGNTKGGNTAST